MRWAAGCLGATLVVPLLLLSLAAALLAAALGALNPFGGVAPGAGGPVYHSGTGNLAGAGNPLQLASIRDLGFGPTDAARIDRMVSSIRPRSPLVGYGAHMLALGHRWRVDPLLIAMWQLESEMATTGINSPTNGGNMTWAAAAPYAPLYGCTPGPSSLGHLWARCPDVASGLSLWYHYVGARYAGFATFEQVVNVYNPCSDPGNIANGFPCGSNYGRLIVRVLRAYSGPPVAGHTRPPRPSGVLFAGEYLNRREEHNLA